MSERQDSRVDDVFSISELVNAAIGSYTNKILSQVNDHVVRVSVMFEPYFWHLHPNSDEAFLVMEGQLGIEFLDREVVLKAGEGLTISRGVAHRTRPIGGRSVNLTVEHAAMMTTRTERDGSITRDTVPGQSGS